MSKKNKKQLSKVNLTGKIDGDNSAANSSKNNIQNNSDISTNNNIQNNSDISTNNNIQNNSDISTSNIDPSKVNVNSGTIIDSSADKNNLTSSIGISNDNTTPFDENAKASTIAKAITFDKKMRPFEMSMFACGILIMLFQWCIGLNIVAIVGALYMCVAAAIICILLFTKKTLNVWTILGYLAVSFGIATFYIFNGADAGWGGFTSAMTGFFTGNHPLWQGEGNFGTRLAGNILIASPTFLILLSMFLVVYKVKRGSISVKNIITHGLSILLVAMSIVFIFTMNLRAKPKAFNLEKGEKAYLDNISKNVNSGSPNVLVIMMDDLGYGDTSYNARKAGLTPAFETPSIDWLAESGLDFDNFYSSYSVCSPARFAMMTGRYPYRGYADNVMYPTVNSLAPFASTRIFNSIEMGANCDGMIGDEVTIAETLKGAGYSTGAFGKWHLGDYGQYLPTNQGFDYFYGSHHVNDMTPFYHSTEKGGEYEISVGTESLNQSNATKLIHNETTNWITEQARNNQKFFAYYATPWPHAPLYAGDEFRGKSGAGIYGDTIMEFDHYLGQLFNTMDTLGVLDDTLIVFTSDNGPALQGSMNELRGGKYSAYEGGQKVPYYMKWGNNSYFSNPANDKKARTISAPATLIDLYPTLVSICNVQDLNGKANYLPSSVDRQIDGVNMMPAILDNTNTLPLHTSENPILHMKREKIKAVQFSLSREQVLASVQNYSQGTDNKIQTGNAADYAELPLIKYNSYTTWKYFDKMKNDNPEFFDKTRKNWLICTTDDKGESYQRADVFPGIAQMSKDIMKEQEKSFKQNRRGVIKEFYKSNK